MLVRPPLPCVGPTLRPHTLMLSTLDQVIFVDATGGDKKCPRTPKKCNFDRNFSSILKDFKNNFLEVIGA